MIFVNQNNVKGKRKNKFKNGFTLIELLVVIAIITILAGLVIIRINSASEDSKYSRAKADIDQLKKAMIAYKIKNGELPDPGDCWATSANESTNQSCWNNVSTALINDNLMSNPTQRDPWGTLYLYNDNDCNSGSPDLTSTYLWTAGSDKTNNWRGSDDWGVEVSGGCSR